LKKLTEAEKKEFENPFKEKYIVDPELCINCKLCLKGGCPALATDKATKKAKIDRLQCLGCGVCAQICPKHAISKEDK